MEVRRTVSGTNDVTASVAALLHGTIDEFREAANHVVRHAREEAGKRLANVSWVDMLTDRPSPQRQPSIRSSRCPGGRQGDVTRPIPDRHNS